MKLTPETLDYEDCRPVQEVTSIKLPPYLQKIHDDHAAAQEAKARPARAERPSPRRLPAVAE